MKSVTKFLKRVFGRCECLDRYDTAVQAHSQVAHATVAAAKATCASIAKSTSARLELIRKLSDATSEQIVTNVASQTDTRDFERGAD